MEFQQNFPVDKLIPYARNSRTHNDEQVAQIMASIKEFGFTNPILIGSDNVIIAGHGRLLAAQRLGLKEVPVIVLPDLTETQRRALVIADNKIALNAGWDEKMLALEIGELREEDFDLSNLGFNPDELKALESFDEIQETGNTEDDTVPEAPVEPTSKRGDVWLLGNHRVMCGDTTMIDDFKTLMQDDIADMVFTDPPYNVNYGATMKDALRYHASPNHGRTIMNDNLGDDFEQFLYDACEAIAKEMGKDMKNTHAVSVRDGVAVIPVTGPLFRHANLLTAVCGATSYEILAQDFNKALNDPNISAIVFDVDSPGGEVNGCSELADMIYNARGKKPVIAYASGSCCSGAYWIASACDKIMAADTAILGSIGVVSIFEKEDDKKTIEIVSSQSPNKRPDVETDEGKAKIQAHIDALAEVFINKIALHRDISPKDVIENFGGGDVFVGQNAVRNGLADSLASFEAIISDLNTQSTEKSFMNDTLEKTAVDIKAQERERMSQVLSVENVKGKEATAQALLAKTDLSASDILAILETVPVAKQTNALDVAMAQIKNPAITPSAEDKEETPEDVANRIASYTIGG